jgi:hypothetical protein
MNKGFMINASGHYYAGYTDKGPQLGPINGGYIFTRKDFAENVLGGDERLKGATIVAVRRNSETKQMEEV